jgi:hypothetical protein
MVPSDRLFATASSSAVVAVVVDLQMLLGRIRLILAASSIAH